MTYAHDTFATVIPYKVDPFKGSNNGEVSRQWAARPADQRFLNLSDMRSKLDLRANKTRDLVVSTRKIEFIAPEPETMADTHKIALALPNGDLVGPTHWSFGQVCARADFSASELRKLPSPLVADVLNYQMRHARGDDQIKTFDVDGTLRAATGPNYGWIKDASVVEAVQQIAGNGTGDMRWKVPGVIDWQTHMYDPMAPVTIDSTTLYASDRDVFIFLVDDTHPIEVGKLEDGSPDLMFRGFFVSNSEVGAGSMRLAAFYLRAVCMNRNLWGVERFEELTIRHTSGAPARFIEEARPALLSFSEASDKKLIDGVKAAKATVIAKEQSEALDFLRNRGVSMKRAKDIIQRDAEAGGQRDEKDFPRTAWSMAQAITATARDIPNSDQRIELEKIAGKILDKVA
jgi:hypothetical protein